MQEKNVTLIVTDAEDSIPSARAFLNNRGQYGNCTVLTFKLAYTPPYERFRGIREYQYATRYIPFRSLPKRDCVVILDVSEWVNHTEDTYLRLFMKYLHDEDSFYRREYLMTVGKADEQSVRNLRLLAAEYLEGGQVIYDKTLCDRSALQDYLQKTYPLTPSAADWLAQIYLSRPIRGMDTVDNITRDLLACGNSAATGAVTAQQLTDRLTHSRNAKIHLFYGEEIQKFLEQQKNKEVGKEKYANNGLPR